MLQWYPTGPEPGQGYYGADDDLILHVPNSTPYRYERSATRLLCTNDPAWIEEMPQGKLIRHFVNHVEDHELGTAFAFDTNFLFEYRLEVDPGPDLVFYDIKRHEELKDRSLIGHFIPDFIAERVRIRGRHNDISRRAGMYLRAGVRLAWFIDLDKRVVTVYRANGSKYILSANDILSGEDVLPGFACPVKEILPDTCNVAA